MQISENGGMAVMYRRVILLCLACAMLITSAACGVLQRPQDPDESGTLSSLLTPEGAVVITNLEDLLILDSTQTLPELIDFYKAVLRELYAQETGLNDRHDGVWIYSGIYEGVNPITIELRGGGENVRIYIIY